MTGSESQRYTIGLIQLRHIYNLLESYVENLTSARSVQCKFMLIHREWHSYRRLPSPYVMTIAIRVDRLQSISQAFSNAKACWDTQRRLVTGNPSHSATASKE